MPKKTTHYLITAPVLEGVNFHCYLVTNNRSDTLAATDRMFREVEKIGGHPLGAVAVTDLGDDAEDVRAIVIARSPDKGATLKAAKNYHFSMFATAKGDPDDVVLMAIH